MQDQSLRQHDRSVAQPVERGRQRQRDQEHLDVSEPQFDLTDKVESLRATLRKMTESNPSRLYARRNSRSHSPRHRSFNRGSSTGAFGQKRTVDAAYPDIRR